MFHFFGCFPGEPYNGNNSHALTVPKTISTSTLDQDEQWTRLKLHSLVGDISNIRYVLGMPEISSSSFRTDLEYPCFQILLHRR